MSHVCVARPQWVNYEFSIPFFRLVIIHDLTQDSVTTCISSALPIKLPQLCESLICHSVHIFAFSVTMNNGFLFAVSVKIYAFESWVHGQKRTYRCYRKKGLAVNHSAPVISWYVHNDIVSL